MTLRVHSLLLLSACPYLWDPVPKVERHTGAETDADADADADTDVDTDADADADTDPGGGTGTPGGPHTGAPPPPPPTGDTAVARPPALTLTGASSDAVDLTVRFLATDPDGDAAYVAVRPPASPHTSFDLPGDAPDWSLDPVASFDRSTGEGSAALPLDCAGDWVLELYDAEGASSGPVVLSVAAVPDQDTPFPIAAFSVPAVWCGEVANNSDLDQIAFTPLADHPRLTFVVAHGEANRRTELSLSGPAGALASSVETTETVDTLGPVDLSAGTAYVLAVEGSGDDRGNVVVVSP